MQKAKQEGLAADSSDESGEVEQVESGESGDEEVVLVVRGPTDADMINGGREAPSGVDVLITWMAKLTLDICCVTSPLPISICPWPLSGHGRGGDNSHLRRLARSEGSS